MMNGFEFSADWVSPHAANWLEWTKDIAGKPNISILEIGSFEGRSACWWLENVLNHPTSRLVCVDPFEWITANHERFWRNIIATGEPHRVELKRERSSIALVSLASQRRQFDLIYIDGSHYAKDVLFDAVLAGLLVKPGGLIIFDDLPYVNENGQPGPGVAVEAWLAANPDAHVLHRGWQCAARAST